MADSNPQDLHWALVSVYFYGRQDQDERLRRARLRLRIWPLARAVNVLSSGPMGPLRLALADLCRTRAKKPDPVVITQMRRLSGAYQTRLGSERDPEDPFEQIFKNPDTREQPEAAYLRALDIMLKKHPSPDAGGPTPAVASYTVGVKTP